MHTLRQAINNNIYFLCLLQSGVVEGKLGSIRIFCVNQEYQRLNVGKRLLHRVERVAYAEGCVRIMFSIPSTRSTLSKWLGFQNYEQVSSIPYPAIYLGHTITVESISLDLYQKPLENGEKKLKSSAASSSPAPQAGESNLINPPNPPEYNTHLPPHWRGIRSSSVKAEVISDVNIHENNGEEHFIDTEIPGVD